MTLHFLRLSALLLPASVLVVACGSLALAAELPGKPGPSPRYDAWRVIGPGGGGTMMRPSISPHHPDIELEYCDMTGAYITVDGGDSYRMFNLLTGVGAFAFDWRDPRVIYAANFGLWRSEDTGKTWSLVLPDPKVTSISAAGDHGELSIKSQDPDYPSDLDEPAIDAVAVDPRDSAHLVIAFTGGWRGTEPHSIRESFDRGETWKVVSDPRLHRSPYLPSTSTLPPTSSP